MEWQTKEGIKLYGKANPRGAPIPINIDAFDISGAAHEDGELREAVAEGLRSGRAGGASRMWAEDMKEWLAGVRQEEKCWREITTK